LSRHPEPSGHALHREVDGFDSEEQHDQKSIPPRLCLKTNKQLLESK